MYAHIWLRAELCCPGACGSGHWWTSGCQFHNCWPECSWCIKTKKGCAEQRKTKILIILHCKQIKKNAYIKWKLLLNLAWNTCRNRLRHLQTEGTNLSKKAASSLLSSTLCLVPALTWQFISWARDIYTEVPAKSIMQTYYPPDLCACETHLLSRLWNLLRFRFCCPYTVIIWRPKEVLWTKLQLLITLNLVFLTCLYHLPHIILPAQNITLHTWD